MAVLITGSFCVTQSLQLFRIFASGDDNKRKERKQNKINKKVIQNSLWLNSNTEQCAFSQNLFFIHTGKSSLSTGAYLRLHQVHQNSANETQQNQNIHFKLEYTESSLSSCKCEICGALPGLLKYFPALNQHFSWQSFMTHESHHTHSRLLSDEVEIKNFRFFCDTFPAPTWYFHKQNL